MRSMPNAGDEVMLAVPQRETVHAKVVESGRDFLELELMASPRTPSFQLERSSLYVEFLNDDGICRVPGKLRPEPGTRLALGRGYGEEMRVRFACKSSVQLLQRRENIRAYAAVGVTVWPASSDAPGQDCRTVDVSGGGLRVRGLRLPRVGERYDFELRLLPRAAPILGRCEVTHLTDEGDAGVRFIQIDEAAQALIVHFAFDSMRAARLG